VRGHLFGGRVRLHQQLGGSGVAELPLARWQVVVRHAQPLALGATPTVAGLGERRETWWRNEMGDKQSHFKPAEQFRR
jgi:hypothetical protein